MRATFTDSLIDVHARDWISAINVAADWTGQIYHNNSAMAFTVTD